MTSVFISLLLTLRGFARSRAALDLEVLALHHQLKMLQRSQTRRLRLVQADRLIRTMSRTNPLWGAPPIHGELLTLGIDVSQATVAKYTVGRDKPASQSWHTFLANHIQQIAAADFFVPGTTCRAARLVHAR